MNKIMNFLFIILIVNFVGCSSTSNSTNEDIILIKGSDTMLQLTQKLANRFSEINPAVKFQVFGGGTKTGIEELLAGRVDICNASRNLTSQEAKSLAEYYGSIGMYYLIAKDAVCIYVNKNNPINNLTLDTLKKIFTFESSEIEPNNYNNFQLVIRDSDSGTREFLKDFILPNEDFGKSAKEIATTEDIIEFIKKNQNGIGFGGIGFAKGVKLLSIEGIEPNVKNTKNDSYPLTRYLHFFTTKSPSGNVKKFIDWVLSPEGQKIVKDEGFVPLWEITY